MRSINFKFCKNRQINKKRHCIYKEYSSQQRFHLDFPYQIEEEKNMKNTIIYCLLVATILSYVHSSEFKIFRKVDVKTKYDLYPKIETFHPPKGYQPVRGYEPVNYRPNILNYFLNHKKKSAPPKTGNIAYILLIA